MASPLGEAEPSAVRQKHICAILNHMNSCRDCRRLQRDMQMCNIPTIEPRGCAWRRSVRQRMLNHKLNPRLYSQGIKRIYRKLRQPIMMPTIDCFSCRRSAQQSANMYITKEQDFFSRTYDCETFWSLSVAWAHPPSNDDMLQRTIKTFKRRRMHGFICGPRWPTELDTRNEDKNAWLQRARRLSGYQMDIKIASRGADNVYFPELYGFRASGGRACQYSTMLVYMDFRVARD